jgi:hypothetical protein
VRVHYPARERGRAYCGGHRPPSELSPDWFKVTCPNCLAAARADRNGSLPRSLRSSAALAA